MLLSPYLELRGLAATSIGLAISVYGIVSLLARVPAGLIYSRRGVGWQVAGGCILMAAAFALLSIARHPLLLAGLIGLDGLGFAIATTAAMAGLMERRPTGANAGSLMAWYTGSVGAGYAAAGFVAGSLADRVGIATAILVLGVIPLLAALLLFKILHRPVSSAPVVSRRATSRGDILSGFRTAPALVWLAFAVSLYINLVSGVVFTFFPLYALSIGLSLTQIGGLVGIHGVTASVVRFGSAPLFSWIPYRRSLAPMVVISGVAVAALSGTRTLFLLAAAWAAIGAARGILRVSSGALVMDATGDSDRQRGATSSIYLAGLDLGKIAGPVLGGLAVEAFGLRHTFVVVGLAFPLVYAVMARAISATSGKGGDLTELTDSASARTSDRA